jgi:hypothetical protein
MSQFTEHAGRLKADLINTDALVVGPQGTNVGAVWLETTTTLAGGTQGANAIRSVRYTVMGKTCTAVYFVAHNGGAGTASTTLTMTLPFRARSVLHVVGSGVLTTTSGNFQLTAFGGTETTFSLFATANGSGPEQISNSSASASRLTEDEWNAVFQITYEIE